MVQRPELTKLIDKDGDGIADEFTTVCDKWGVSGDYHEFAFGPARDKDGQLLHHAERRLRRRPPGEGPVARLVREGHARTARWSPSPTACVRPTASTSRPDGDLFYCDNQGEWVATNKMHHLKRGKFYGHQAGLRWVKDSPFAGKVPDKVASGMLYDGTQLAEGRPAAHGPSRFTRTSTRRASGSPTAAWASRASEPVWDTTGGKFGPFAGQCFVGDQTNVDRHAGGAGEGERRLSGGVLPVPQRLAVRRQPARASPRTAACIVGQTNRGWGSLGGKPYGLQRLAYTGERAVRDPPRRADARPASTCLHQAARPGRR